MSSQPWLSFKTEGMQYYQSSSFEPALKAFTAAVNSNPGPSKHEAAVLQSNIAACYLSKFINPPPPCSSPHFLSFLASNS
jgi:hypothetical protein